LEEKESLIMMMTVWVIVGVVNGLNAREEEDRRRNLGRLVSKREREKKLGVNRSSKGFILFFF